MSINWATIYNNPVGQILGDFNPSTFTSVMTQGTQTRLTDIQNQSQGANTQISAWTTLQSDAQTVSGDIANLDLSQTFQPVTASANTANVTAAADSSAKTGTYNLYVDQLAQAELDRGQPPAAITSDTTALNFSGSFQIYTGSAPTTSVTVSTGDSLQQIVDNINQAATGVTATAVQVNGSWTIEVQANSSGAANTIHFVATNPASGTQSPLYQLGLWNTSLSTPTYFSGEQQQAAQDASVNFGTSANPTAAVTSSSNTLNNVIPGVTLQVSGTGAATVSVSPDVNAMSASVQKLVTDWNQWVSDTANLAAAGSVVATGTGSSASYHFQANSQREIQSALPQNALNQMRTLLASTIGTSGDTYLSLAGIGLNLDTSGKMTVDTSTLNQALSSQPGAVLTLFQRLYALVNPTGGGGVLTAFYQGPQSVSGEAIAYETGQASQLSQETTLLKNQLNAQEQQAIVQYGQWVNQIAGYAQQNSMLSVLFNQNQKTGG